MCTSLHPSSLGPRPPDRAKIPAQPWPSTGIGTRPVTPPVPAHPGSQAPPRRTPATTPRRTTYMPPDPRHWLRARDARGCTSIQHGARMHLLARLRAKQRFHPKIDCAVFLETPRHDGCDESATRHHAGSPRTLPRIPPWSQSLRIVRCVRC
ncbi:hypothetical protein C8J57DRAFT_113351 [Mycena rebaudengoi]|nr:hypothetical protein C8J57DRAFT_113351 [Mycena rebaudengoi]